MCLSYVYDSYLLIDLAGALASYYIYLHASSNTMLVVFIPSSSFLLPSPVHDDGAHDDVAPRSSHGRWRRRRRVWRRSHQLRWWRRWRRSSHDALWWKSLHAPDDNGRCCDAQQWQRRQQQQQCSAAAAAGRDRGADATRPSIRFNVGYSWCRAQPSQRYGWAFRRCRSSSPCYDVPCCRHDADDDASGRHATHANGSSQPSADGANDDEQSIPAISAAAHGRRSKATASSTTSSSHGCCSRCWQYRCLRHVFFTASNKCPSPRSPSNRRSGSYGLVGGDFRVGRGLICIGTATAAAGGGGPRTGRRTRAGAKEGRTKQSRRIFRSLCLIIHWGIDLHLQSFAKCLPYRLKSGSKPCNIRICSLLVS